MAAECSVTAEGEREKGYWELLKKPETEQRWD